ncbi:hypothetical protein Syun_012872 [Stephania yunnanensis]|uniref:Uncharacterized protein n=1 Tax=Stephania yunnanensis TaxID=152371 RepID=A0AAP0K0A0_9MAGN
MHQMQAKVSDGDDNHRGVRELWTNERHAKYLTQMEASFVQNLSVSIHKRRGHLCREIPDGSESTRDSRHPRSKRSNTNSSSSSTATNGTTTGVDRAMGPLHSTTTLKLRRRFAQPSTDSSQDQVVPEIGNSKSDN